MPSDRMTLTRTAKMPVLRRTAFVSRRENWISVGPKCLVSKRGVMTRESSSNRSLAMGRGVSQPHHRPPSQPHRVPIPPTKHSHSCPTRTDCRRATDQALRIGTYAATTPATPSRSGPSPKPRLPGHRTRAELLLPAVRRRGTPTEPGTRGVGPLGLSLVAAPTSSTGSGVRSSDRTSRTFAPPGVCPQRPSHPPRRSTLAPTNRRTPGRRSLTSPTHDPLHTRRLLAASKQLGSGTYALAGPLPLRHHDYRPDSQS